jgi:hypothetical protein
MAVAVSGLAALAWMATALRPTARISAARASAFSADFSYVIATSAPSFASFSAMAAPMPRAVPVISARLPARGRLGVNSMEGYLEMLGFQFVRK